MTEACSNVQLDPVATRSPWLRSGACRPSFGVGETSSTLGSPLLR